MASKRCAFASDPCSSFFAHGLLGGTKHDSDANPPRAEHSYPSSEQQLPAVLNEAEFFKDIAWVGDRFTHANPAEAFGCVREARLRADHQLHHPVWRDIQSTKAAIIPAATRGAARSGFNVRKCAATHSYQQQPVRTSTHWSTRLTVFIAC